MMASVSEPAMGASTPIAGQPIVVVSHNVCFARDRHIRVAGHDGLCVDHWKACVGGRTKFD